MDGHPDYHPHQGAGCFGLAIVMRANEQTHNRTHNCVFRKNMLVVGRCIPKDQELLVHYGEGDDYTRVGYTMTNNTKRDDDPSDEFHKLKIPASRHIINKWATTLQLRINNMGREEDMKQT